MLLFAPERVAFPELLTTRFGIFDHTVELSVESPCVDADQPDAALDEKLRLVAA